MGDDELNMLRKEIDKTDEEIMRLIKKRLATADKIAEHKQKTGMPALDRQREQEVLERMNEESRNAAQQYLGRIAGETSYEGVEIQPVVVMGKTAETICEFAEKNGFDLIIMATHGRSGVKRLVWGSVADKVLRSSCVPVLLVRPPGCVPGF